MQAECAAVCETLPLDVYPSLSASRREPAPADCVEADPAEADLVEIVETVGDGAGGRWRMGGAVGRGGYILILQLEGSSEVGQDGAKMILAPDDLVLLDACTPARMRASSPARQLHVYLRAAVAQQLVGRHIPPIGAISGICGLAVGLRGLILAMRGVLVPLTHREQRGLQSALFDLALAGMTPGPGRIESRAPHRTQGCAEWQR